MALSLPNTREALTEAGTVVLVTERDPAPMEIIQILCNLIIKRLCLWQPKR